MTDKARHVKMNIITLKRHDFERKCEMKLNVTEEAKKLLLDRIEQHNMIDPSYYSKYDVKRGLRNADGTGVVAGITNICNVHGYVMNEGEKQNIEGELYYRGYNVSDLVSALDSEERFGYEEVVYLLLMGSLPSKRALKAFEGAISNNRDLPDGFFEDMILKAPSRNIMNKISRSILALYSYDDFPEAKSAEDELMTAVSIIAKLPVIMASAYQAKRRFYDSQTMFMHQVRPEESTAETILSLLRFDRKYSYEEAKLLDTMLMLHAEHGGGNNSAFACRVLTSSGTDPYSAYAAAVGALKGPLHGGANQKILEQHDYIKANVRDWNDEEEVREILRKILKKEAGDRSGKIYGMGHAVYTLSDPRAIILKREAKKLAAGTEYEAELELLEAVERNAQQVFAEVTGKEKTLCANVDMYSGMCYRMLGIPDELCTPMFAVARIAGWAAHRIEERLTGGRIIRPAYKAVSKPRAYVTLADRG